MGKKAKGFQLAKYTSRYEKEQGKYLVSQLALHWLFRAVPRQHHATQNNKNKKTLQLTRRQIQKTTPILTGKLLTGAVETTLTANQESGQTQNRSKGL